MSHPEAPTPALLSDQVSGRELVSEVIAQWARGVPPDARAFLARHPELSADKSLVLDLAYEEYCCRKEAGESPDPDEFCARFPSFQASLRRLIRAHQFLESSSPLAAAEAKLPPPQPGDTVLGFSLVRELGRGSFAHVFLAAEPAVGNRLVAVKIALRGAAEAKTLGRLRHPNIVRVYSVHEDEVTGVTAVCMPYSGSATLCDVLDRAFGGTGVPTDARLILECAQEGFVPEAGTDDGQPPDPVLRTGTYVDGVVRLGAQLGEALAFTHRQGIYHRDLKPSNVLLTPAGKPMLLDFNLSFDGRISEERLGGTLPYMAPEHLRATDLERGVDPSLVDARSDVFSLGVILYELLAGVNPFGPIPPKASSAEVRAHLLQRQRAGPNSLRRANGHVDRSLARVIERCLAFDPRDRYQTAEELAAALRINLLSWKPARWVRIHRRGLLRAAVAVLVAGGTAGYLSSRMDPPHVRFLRAGLCAYQAQDYPTAAEQFGQAAQLDPGNPWVWFARGRCYQAQATRQRVRGEKSAANTFRAALDDYERASRFAEDGRIYVCMAVCNSLMPRHPVAIAQYERARKAGFVSAELFNDLGFSHLQSGNLDEALECLNRAISGNPQLAEAYHNRAWVRLQQLNGMMRPTKPTGGAFMTVGAAAMVAYLENEVAAMIDDIEQAVARRPVCEETSKLYADAACAFALAARMDERRFPEALGYESRAAAHGQNPVDLRNALCYWADRPLAAAALARPTGKPLPMLRVVDPLAGIPAELLVGP